MSIKKTVQKAVLLPRQNKYNKERLDLMEKYDSNRKKLISYVTKDEVTKETSRKVECILAQKLMESCDLKIEDDKFYFVSSSESGMVLPETARVICEFVSDNPSLTVCYGDEDYFALWEKENGEVFLSSDSRRCFRYFKPKFSPETLCEFNYINAFAVRGDCLKDVLPKVIEKQDEDVFLYELITEAAAWTLGRFNEESIAKIPRVLTSNPIAVTESEFQTIEKKGNAASLLLKYFENSNLHGISEKYSIAKEKAKDSLDVLTEPFKGRISVLIPSKDNPEMLIRCIDRLNIKAEDGIEIIVVDNGSTQANKDLIEHYLMKREFETTYIYEEEEFNYSRMNNVAASKAKGDVLLLLNDDVEAFGNEWIKRMASHAVKDKVGCVGCKLLYPSKMIQHVGISCGIDGPAHKYLGERDDVRRGFGDNTLNRNVLALTGACLCTEKRKYDEVGGLSEELKVGYNDIDLCMNMYDKGYRNILLNDIVNIHHESVSRGVDAKSKAKASRLRDEKKVLISKHKDLMTYDPYEGGGEDFSLKYERECNREQTERINLKVSRHETDTEGWIFSSFEKLSVNKDKKLSAKGFAIVPGIDNMRFDFEMLLKRGNEVNSIEYGKCLRNDLQERFQGTDNTELCGFDFTCDLSMLEGGEYTVSFYAKDHGNVRELITDSEMRIEL